MGHYLGLDAKKSLRPICVRSRGLRMGSLAEPGEAPGGELSGEGEGS